jgi:single-stranded-DNA-specific exonuclease
MEKIKENILKSLKNYLDKKQEKRNANLTLKDLPNPDLIPNMKEAAEKICKRIRENKKILLVGDYDTDGIMATSIFKLFFEDLGYQHLFSYIIPDRFKDGYGVSKNIIDYAILNGYDFIVTVDNGIGAVDAIKYAKEHGIYVIITDHHLPGKEIPNADILVDLKYNPGNFPYIEISGATVAWYLIAEIRRMLNVQIDLRKYLDLVAITVISDVMPLEDINLAFYRYGLKKIKENPRPFEILFFKNDLQYIDETDLGFNLIPKLNATGRIAHASLAVELVTAKDMYTASMLVQKIEEINEKRKMITQQYLDMLKPQISEQQNNNAIIIKEKNLNEGIVGIIAGKIAEKYNKPVYVFSWNNEKQLWKGSGRTSGEIHLYDLTEHAKEFIVGFGGHAGAVGLSVLEKDFENFKNKILEKVNSFEKDIFFDKNFELEIPLELIDDEDIISLLEQYKPYGEKFEFPKLYSKGYIKILNTYKNGWHNDCVVFNEKTSKKIWFFNHKDFHLENLNEEKKFYFTFKKKREIEFYGILLN